MSPGLGDVEPAGDAVDTRAPAALPGAHRSDARTRAERALLNLGYVLAFALVGLLSAMLGPSLTTLSHITGSSLSSLGILFTVDSFGSVCGSLLAGHLLNRLSTHVQAIGALVVITLVCAVLPTIRSATLLVPAWWILGMSKTFLIVTVNTLFIWIHRGRVGSRMNVADFFLGLGSLLMPVAIAQSLTTTGELRGAYWSVCGVALLLTAILAITLPGPRTATSLEPDSPGRTGKRWILAAVTVLLFFYVGAELSFSGWVASYALDRGITSSAATAAYFTSLFWLAVTGGRLLWLPITVRTPPSRVLGLSVVGCVLSIALICASPSSGTVLTVGSICFGLAMSSIFPAAFTLLSDRVGVTGKVSGLALCTASLGAMFFPWWIGQVLSFHTH